MPTHLHLTQRVNVTQIADDLAEAFEALAFNAKGEGREQCAQLLTKAAADLRGFADAYEAALKA